jgi:hypothetical protein
VRPNHHTSHSGRSPNLKISKVRLQIAPDLLRAVGNGPALIFALASLWPFRGWAGHPITTTVTLFKTSSAATVSTAVAETMAFSLATRGCCSDVQLTSLVHVSLPLATLLCCNQRAKLQAVPLQLGLQAPDHGTETGVLSAWFAT